jgi:hypothetical protein
MPSSPASHHLIMHLIMLDVRCGYLHVPAGNHGSSHSSPLAQNVTRPVLLCSCHSLPSIYSNNFFGFDLDWVSTWTSTWIFLRLRHDTRKLRAPPRRVTPRVAPRAKWRPRLKCWIGGHDTRKLRAPPRRATPRVAPRAKWRPRLKCWIGGHDTRTLRAPPRRATPRVAPRAKWRPRLKCWIGGPVSSCFAGSISPFFLELWVPQMIALQPREQSFAIYLEQVNINGHITGHIVQHHLDFSAREAK